MKKLLSLLIVSLFAISLIGFASAGDIEIIIYMEGEIVSPAEGSHVSGDVLISWENGNFEVGWLKYKEGACDKTASGEILAYQITGEGNYIWDTDTSDTPDGKYCIKITGTETIFGNITVTIDNTAPEIYSFIAPEDGDEDSVKSEVYVGATDNIGITFCEISWGDGDTKDCSADTSKTYKHQYNDNGPYTITLTVEDGAGNSDSATTSVNPENLDPEITAQIDAPDNNDEDLDLLVEAAVGEAVKFTASGNDVDADLKDGLTCTWTFDGVNPESTTANEFGDCEVYYTWDFASVHTVDLTITDKDGGSVDADQFELEVEEPVYMNPMQQVVAKEVFEFDLESTWAVPNKKRFKTIISGITDCEAVVVPTGMVISQQGPTTPEGRCQVDWIPSNNQRGEHLVIIKAYNGFYDEFKYYSFDVTVYSWGIELVEGWNLISIPYMPADTKINSVFGDIIEHVAYEGDSTYTIYQYDAIKDKWYRARKYKSNSGYTASSNKLTTIVPGYGYWIKMDTEDWIYGAEKNFPVNTVPGATGIDLATESWNLIGRFGIDSASSDWWTALKTLMWPFYMDDYVSDYLGIYKLISITDSGNTVWDHSDKIELAQGYWVRTAAGSEGRTTVKYEPDTI